MDLSPSRADKTASQLVELGLTLQWPDQEPIVMTGKRKLDTKKCTYCRRDKQKCTPQQREWPAQRCFRCELKGFPCSVNDTSRNAPVVRSSTKCDLGDIKDKAIRELLEEKYLLSVLERACRELQSIIEGWMELFPPSCILSAQSHVDTRRELYENASVAYLQRLRRFNRIWKDTCDSRIEEALLLPSILQNPEQLNSSSIWAIFDYSKDSIHSLAERMYRKGNISTADVLLEGLIVANYQLVGVEDGYTAPLKLLIDLRNKFALRASSVFNRLDVLPLVGGMITRHIPLYALPELVLHEAAKDYPFMGVDFTSQTQLHYVTGRLNTWLIEGLLERSPSPNAVNAQDILGRTALHIACEKRNVKAVQILMLAGADPRIPARGGMTPLHFAAASGDVESVQYLVEQVTHQFAADVLDEEFRSPLFYAACNGHIEAVRVLLGFCNFGGCHRRDINGRTPISWAAERGHEPIVKMLVLERPVPWWFLRPDDKGLTPIDYGNLGSHHSIVEFLSQAQQSAPSQSSEPQDAVAHNGVSAAGPTGDKLLLGSPWEFVTSQRENANPSDIDPICSGFM